MAGLNQLLGKKSVTGRKQQESRLLHAITLDERYMIIRYVLITSNYPVIKSCVTFVKVSVDVF